MKTINSGHVRQTGELGRLSFEEILFPPNFLIRIHRGRPIAELDQQRIVKIVITDLQTNLQKTIEFPFDKNNKEEFVEHE